MWNIIFTSHLLKQKPLVKYISMHSPPLTSAELQGTVLYEFRFISSTLTVSQLKHAAYAFPVGPKALYNTGSLIGTKTSAAPKCKRFNDPRGNFQTRENGRKWISVPANLPSCEKILCFPGGPGRTDLPLHTLTNMP